METTKFKSVDAYLASLPAAVKERAEQLRAVIREAAPEAEESISYNIPTYKFHGVLIYFAAHKHHFGLYPVAAEIKEFEEELAEYRAAKGTLQFPFNKPIPFDLVSQIVALRAAANLEKANGKK